MSFSTSLRPMRPSTRLQQSVMRAFPRPFTSTLQPSKKMMDTPNPASNIPDAHPNSSAAPNAKVRSDTQNTDQQSSASPDEMKQGDEHPAKQPDFQEKPDRTTGIGGKEKVEGGKEGLGERT